VLTSGCSDLGYLTQSVRGHLQLLDAARPVPEVLADPATAPALKDRLELAQRMRDFAVAELHLPDNASYRRYADLRRPAAVWNVVAAPELSLTLQTWCFPVVGCVAYRGYYQRDEAEAYAATLRALEAKGVVRGDQEHWSLVHDAIVEQLTTSSDPDTVRAAHRDLASALVASRTADRLSAAVRHCQLGGDDAQAGALFTQLVSRARSRGDRRSAQQLLADTLGESAPTASSSYHSRGMWAKKAWCAPARASCVAWVAN
jgi:predicted aminopeptidase